MQNPSEHGVNSSTYTADLRELNGSIDDSSFKAKFAQVRHEANAYLGEETNS